MGRRIEVELTSTRDDGSWTWRAAGAKQPKGELSGDLLYSGAKVGDVVKVEADFHIDGIEVVEVFTPKAKKERSNLLEMKSRPFRDDELVTTQRVSRGRGGKGGRRGDRPNRDRRDRADSRRSPRPDRPQRPKPKRLRPKRVHRDALLASVGEEHQPIVEQLIRDGMPGVRAAIDKQNAEAKASGKPEIEAGPVVAIAERHLAAARLAEWRDRADAALGDIDELDLRDLRSVVVVGNDIARDDESRAISEQLKSALDSRMERDHEQWLSDLRNAVSDGRVVRALRLSSRPVKAGAPLPTELAGELSRQAATALAADVEPSRWAVVLDALAFSPVRGAVTPAGIPAEPGDELIDEVKRLSDRVPAIAALFGIDPAEVPKRIKRRRPPRAEKRSRPKEKQQPRGGGDKPKPERTVDESPKAEAPKPAESEAEASEAVEAAATAETAETTPTPAPAEAVEPVVEDQTTDAEVDVDAGEPEAEVANSGSDTDTDTEAPSSENAESESPSADENGAETAETAEADTTESSESDPPQGTEGSEAATTEAADEEE